MEKHVNFFLIEEGTPCPASPRGGQARARGPSPHVLGIGATGKK